MPLDRSVLLAVAVVLAGTLATAPALGLFAVPSGEAATYGEGSLTATDAALPDSGFTLDRGDYDARAYHLTVPAASATVTEVTGHPRVVYKLRIPGLGWTSASTTFLASADAGARSFTFRGATFAPDRVTRDSYDAEAVLLVRAGGEKHVLARANVTVEVNS
ncbi:hypothetical protein [Halocalculus aciditolerans]|uniref:Uncharacterized protein n=1 Tax=Halocalculus aciditolerans TaxID=1383812 RepID=A0A830F4C3_9EURY|nr:hypothetical protein [Halocalculus aciditolerans]GGL61482.1 hypothetical protein GCM10009039_19590 [Halocalculus aciditolerans]